MKIKTFLTYFFALMLWNVLAEPQLVDENVFFKKSISFTPPDKQQQDQLWLRKPTKKFNFPNSQMREINGVPFILADGRKLSFFTRSVNRYVASGAPVERAMRESGVNCFMIDIYLPESPATAPRDSFFNFKRYANKILESVPDAFLMIRFWMPNVTEDFVKNHPDALLTGPDGKKDWGATYHSKHNFRPNFLNEWRLYFGELLYKFIDRLGNSKYAPRTVGIYVAAMNSGEWWFYKGRGDPGWDYSKTRKEAFKHFLQAKYKGQLSELKKRWQVKSDAELYRLPTLQERTQKNLQPCSRVSDYNQTLNLPVTNAAIYFAKIIKNLSGGRLLAGMEIHAHLNIMNCNGTVFVRQLLECPEIDFLGGPPFYADRNLGNSAPPHYVGASFRKYHKMFFVEGDFRTHQAYGTASGTLGEPPIDPAGSVEMLRREFMRGMLKQYPIYLMDFGWPWFYDPLILKEIGNMECLAQFMSETGVKRNAEIALVSDQESQLYSNYFANATHLREQVMEKLGADYDYYELTDFLNGTNYKQYKMVVFLNIRALNDNERKSIDKLKSDNRLLLWFHDPGIIDLSRTDSKPDDNLYKLTGIKLHKAGERNKIRIGPDIANLRRELPGIDNHNFHYRGKGAEAEKAKLWKQVSLSDSAAGKYVGNAVYDIRNVDEKAVVLGADAAGNGRFVIKKFPNWTSVYTASCLLPETVIRALSMKAGCHIYINDGDICFSAEKYVGIHAIKAGMKNISLPAKSDVYEIFSNNIIARNVDKFSVPMAFGQTRLFYLGNPEAAQQLISSIRIRQEKSIAEFKRTNPAPDVAAGSYNWSKASSPETFYKLRRKKLASDFGPYPIRKQVPGAMLVSGPYAGNTDIFAMAANLKEVSLAIKDPQSPELSRKTNRYLKLARPLPDNDTSKGPAPWRALAIDRPWFYADEFGIGKGQCGLIAFYVVGQPGTETEVAFRHHGEAQLYINGKVFNGEKSVVGKIFKFVSKSNLFVIALKNTDGDAGFTCKFLQKTTDLKPGKQAIKSDKNIQIYLTDINTLAKKVTERKKALSKTIKAPLAASPGITLIKPNEAIELKNWDGKANLADISRNGGKGLKVASVTHLKYKKKFNIDPSKNYFLSAWMKYAEPGSTQPNMYIGFIAYDKNGRLITSQSVHNFRDTLTVLTKPAKAGDSKIVIGNGANWKAANYACVAFNADSTGQFKDLPNYDCSSLGISKVTRQGEHWVVELKTPLKKDYPVGTVVREHKRWSYYNFVNGGKITNSWKRYYGNVQGISHNLPERGKWWPGTVSAQVVICVNIAKNNAPIIINDIKLTAK